MIHYRLFGIPVCTADPFPGCWTATSAAPDPTAVLGGELPPWPGSAEGGWDGVVDGGALEVERSGAGEHRFCARGEPLFHLSADHRVLTCSPAAPRDTRWWRMLLDPVLFTVGLLRGAEALHAGAVATPSGVLAIAAVAGAGKSTLVGELLRGGHELVTDDILFIEPAGDQLLAHPGPPLMTLPRERSAGVGRRLDDVGDEVWAAVPVVSGPRPLRRIVFLDRRAGEPAAIHPVTNPLIPLVTHLLKFPAGPGRELARFSLASAISTGVEVRRVVADVGVSPQQLAELALAGID